MKSRREGMKGDGWTDGWCCWEGDIAGIVGSLQKRGDFKGLNSPEGSCE